MWIDVLKLANAVVLMILFLTGTQSKEQFELRLTLIASETNCTGFF